MAHGILIWPTGGRVIGIIKAVWGVALITVLVASCWLLVWRLQGKRVMSVQSASMLPTFRPGDAVIAEPIQLRNMHYGDVISYHNPDQPRVLITHRVVQINKKSGQIITQGDALNSPDAPFPARLVTGQVTTILPGFGRLLTVVRRPLGLAILVYIPATLIVIAEVRRWDRSYQSLYRLKRRS